MSFAVKLLLTSIIFIVISGFVAAYGDDTDNDKALVSGVITLIISCIAFIISLLLMIWI